MNINMELKNKYVKLIPYDEKYLDYLYSYLTTNNLEGFENCQLKQKSDLYEFMSNPSMNIKAFIKDMSNEKIIGFVSGYNYNKIDGYIYITSTLDEQINLNQEALNIFIDYLIKSFPIRKIYCDIFENHYKKLELFESNKFKKEATLEKDVFWNGQYYNKYILAVYREELNND